MKNLAKKRTLSRFFAALAAIIAPLFLSGALSADEAVRATPPNAEREPNPGRAQEMHRIEENFYGFWKLSISPTPDYKAIRQALDRMDESVGTIRTTYPSSPLEKPLQELSSKIGRLKKAAGNKDLSAIRKGYDDLHQSCFHCHFTHEMPQ